MWVPVRCWYVTYLYVKTPEQNCLKHIVYTKFTYRLIVFLNNGFSEIGGKPNFTWASYGESFYLA